MTRAEKYKARRSAAEIEEGKLRRNRVGTRQKRLFNKAHEFHKKAEANGLLIISYGTKFQVYSSCPGNPILSAMVSLGCSLAKCVHWLILRRKRTTRHRRWRPQPHGMSSSRSRSAKRSKEQRTTHKSQHQWLRLPIAPMKTQRASCRRLLDRKALSTSTLHHKVEVAKHPSHSTVLSLSLPDS